MLGTVLFRCWFWFRWVTAKQNSSVKGLVRWVTFKIQVYIIEDLIAS
jgi:hypothetical protein